MDLDKLCEITRCNLDLYREQKERIAVGADAHISQLCRYFCTRKLTDDGEARRLYTELVNTVRATESERAIFCRQIYNIAKEENCKLLDYVLPIEKPKKNATVSYLRSPLCDRAYDKFSRHFDSLAANYEGSFADCAQSLYAGDCDYIILPISDSKGRLLSFYSIIERYELRLVLCTEVTDEINERSNLFALLSRDTALFECRGKTYLDLLLSDPNSDFVRLLKFADSVSIKPYSVDTMGSSFEDARLHIIFDITDKNFYPLIAYTFLEVPRHIIQGIYKEI